MRKILVLAAVAALAFTSCMKSDDPYKNIRPVAQGVNIYNATMMMQRIAMQPADMVMRLAVLEAEAYKQDPTASNPDLTKVSVDNKYLAETLLGKLMTLTTTADGYKMVIKSDVLYDSYWCEGTINVKTNGLRLANTSQNAAWEVTLGSDFKVVLYTGTTPRKLNYGAAAISLYYDGSAYAIRVSGVDAVVDTTTTNSVHSNWTSSLDLMAPSGNSIAYTDIKGKRFGINGEGSGASCVTLDGTTAPQLIFNVSDGITIKLLQLYEGDVTCSYKENPYTVDAAQVEWRVPAGKTSPVATMSYNGKTANVTGFIG